MYREMDENNKRIVWELNIYSRLYQIFLMSKATANVAPKCPSEDN